jgi:hypothetical protein
MHRVILAFLVALLATAGLSSAAEARGHVGVGIGIGLGGWGYPYYPGYYGYPAYYPYYYPPAVYQAPPTVVYAQPAAPAYYVQPSQQAYGQVPLQPQAQQSSYPSVTPTSNTFVDEQGRSCRLFQSEMDGAPVSGKACLQPDGSWRTAE